MKLTLSSWIASRYLWSKRSGRFAILLTATAIASIAVGVMALIVVMSIMRGFRIELADKLMGFNAHITVTKQAEAPSIEDDKLKSILEGIAVRDAVPYVQGEVIAEARSGGELVAQGARVRGIDADRMGSIQEVRFYYPPDSAGSEALVDGSRKAVVGNEVAVALMIHADFGDRITLVAPLAEVGPTGELMPNRMTLGVEGVFRAGVFDYDSKYILTSRDDARELLGQQVEEGWLVRIDDASEVPAAVAAIRERLPEGWSAVGIDEQNKKLFAALALERVAMGGILIMVLMIASCAIAGVVLLITSAKRKDVAILASIGMDVRGIKRIFIANAAFVGALGAAIGLALGLAGCLFVEAWPIRLPESYYLDYLPVKIDFGYSVLFAACGVIVAILASIYPVRQASKINVIDVLRYE